MGTMQCNRAGCEEILCNRYSCDYGYICWDCFKELVELGSSADAKTFMSTPKRTTPDPYRDPYEYWDEVFPMRGD